MFILLQGTDETMLEKLHNQHSKNKNYLMPKSTRNMSFGLNHFAGVVFYDAKGNQFITRHFTVVLSRLADVFVS